MKRVLKHFLTVIALIFAVFISSCGRDVVTKPDTNQTEVTILKVYTEDNVIYSSADQTDVPVIEEGKHSADIEISDGSDMYRLTLFAEYNSVRYEIKTLASPKNGTNTIEFGFENFPVVAQGDYQQFRIYAILRDNAEKEYSSGNIQFSVKKAYPFTLMYNELGLLTEIEGAGVDFRDKNGKLAFVQFMFKGCFSCIVEARAMKAMYEDAAYDREKYSHSLFGRLFDTERQFKDWKTKEENFPFDCFLDQPENKAKTFFEKLYGDSFDTAVFAVLPDGSIIKYAYSSEPQDHYAQWVKSVYALVYPE